MRHPLNRGHKVSQCNPQRRAISQSIGELQDVEQWVKGSPSVEHSMVGEGQMRGIQKILSQHLKAVWEFAVVWLHAHKYAKMSHASALNPYTC